jgi:hypothetical protein
VPGSGAGQVIVRGAASAKAIPTLLRGEIARYSGPTEGVALIIDARLPPVNGLAPLFRPDGSNLWMKWPSSTQGCRCSRGR